MEEEKEPALFQDVASLASGYSSFTIRTKDFSAFQPRTIFIDIEKTEWLNKLKDTVDAFFKLNSFYKIKIDSRPFHPHVTIATRDLFKKTFSEAWPIFEKETFKEEWDAGGLSVLRHNKKTWDVIYTSPFV